MIKAIQTHYNGYHFRSRLEARWAVFFDELGVRYEYEPDGYDLGDLGWYLPDFWLPELRTWFEIKPLSEKPVVPKVYCAGRIGYHNSDWRRDYGASVYGSVEEMLESGPVYAEIGMRKYGGIAYAGPHLIDPDAPGHGRGFGAAVGHVDDRRELVNACLQQIKDADIVMALLYDDEAYGTLVEIGYAKALGKPVWVAAGPFFDSDEHWFALQLADKVVGVDGAYHAMAEMFPWPSPEIAKTSALLRQEETKCAFVAYGDPLDDSVHRCYQGAAGQWCTLMKSIIYMAVANNDMRRIKPFYIQQVQAAATAARAARFEHGQNGAR